MRISRRSFLKGTAASVGALALPFQVGCQSDPPPYVVFNAGVASGDPLADAFIIWTRVSTATAATDVTWEVAKDSGFDSVVAMGTATASPDRDYCVKVDVTGLSAGTTYYYRWKALGETSAIGRAKTLPAAGVKSMRIGLAACASYAHGWFHGYRELAERDDLDVLLHLGDYIYEYKDGAFGDIRTYDPPTECLTLEDYRRRYAHYRRDPDVRALHESVAMIAIWDDHETADNSYPGGAVNHNPGEGDWPARVMAGQQAWHEWMPVRDQADPRKIWRSFSLGGLADLYMLDTRMWGRDKQLAPSDPLAMDPMRQLLGVDQEAWLKEELAKSTATWRLIGQQVMVAQLPFFVTDDAWDAYPRARERLLDVMNAGNRNVVVLTGDIHTTWVMDLTPDAMDPTKYNGATGEGSRAVEFIVPGITSMGLTDTFQEGAEAEAAKSPWIKYVDVYRKGYGILEVTPERCSCEFYHFKIVETEEPQQSVKSIVARVDSGKHFATVERLT
jgi:alkaline phosphatase D